MIELVGASLVYRDHEKEVNACKEIDLSLKQGEFLGILGPSGSGKSSLLYLMCGLKVPTCGTVKYRGRDIQEFAKTERDRLRLEEFGFVFQYPYLIGYLSALENVLVADPKAKDSEEAIALFERLDIADKTFRMPYELSGEKQRVCVARALIGGSHVIFADEPTAALDHASGLQVMDLLAEHRGEGALVVVTHDTSMLERADRVVTINNGELV